MDGRKKALPIGIEFFRDFKRDNYYYVDKTAFIAELLRTKGAVNLFTRPRRFGKSLNINMLKSFFEIGTDPSLFEGLDISKETELCERHMGKHPVPRKNSIPMGSAFFLPSIWESSFPHAEKNT